MIQSRRCYGACGSALMRSSAEVVSAELIYGLGVQRKESQFRNFIEPGGRFPPEGTKQLSELQRVKLQCAGVNYATGPALWAIT